MRNWFSIAAPPLIGVAMIALFVAFAIGRTETGGVEQSSGADPTAEAIASTAALKADDLSSFDNFGSGDCPLDWRRIQFEGETNAYLACFGSGFVTNLAVSGEGRAEIDAQTRADGYNPDALHAPGQTPQPFTPIHGSFILDHHGVFEVYDRVLVLRTDEDAHQEFLRLTSPNPDQYPLDYERLTANFEDEELTQGGVLGPDATHFETSYVTTWREGRVIGELNTMGSPDMGLNPNKLLVALMDERIRNAVIISTP